MTGTLLARPPRYPLVTKVRLAMAESLSLSHAAPAQIIAALASDQPEIAAIVLLRRR